MTSREPDRPYKYFVSYNWGGGWGSHELNLSQPIRGWSDISLVTEVLVRSVRRDKPCMENANVVIVNYQLMSGPEDVVPSTPAQLVAEQSLRDLLAMVDQFDTPRDPGRVSAFVSDVRRVAFRGLGGTRG
ncbi:hypothetical protein AB0K35_27850 [Micromonospora sp. NPDC053740]|uniref:hypothetical protein n=1 Tax=Micromonospora sp. NPDC053740 TaxID=3155173 RepID=UPI003433E7DC